MSEITNPDIRSLDGSLLLVLRELLRTRNVTRSARQLHLSQSAVSQALSRLRIAFDDPLFERRPHGLQPTPKALRIAPQVDALIDMTRGLLAGDVGFDPATTGRRFMVAAPEYLLAAFGATLVGMVARSAPASSVVCRTLAHEPALEGLVAGEIDLVVGRFGDLRRPGLAATPLHDDRYCVVARRKHPQIRGTLDARGYIAAGHVLVANRSEGDPGERLPTTQPLRTVAVVPTWSTALSMVAATDAIATCPRRLAQALERAWRLQVIALPFRLPKFRVSAVVRERHADEGVDWLLARVNEAMD